MIESATNKSIERFCEWLFTPPKDWGKQKDKLPTEPCSTDEVEAKVIEKGR